MKATVSAQVEKFEFEQMKAEKKTLEQTVSTAEGGITIQVKREAGLDVYLVHLANLFSLPSPLLQLNFLHELGVVPHHLPDAT